jgi:HEAT repeat protein
VTELIAALKDRDWAVRCDAVKALEQIGPEAKEAMPAFREDRAGEGGSSLLDCRAQRSG